MSSSSQQPHKWMQIIQWVYDRITESLRHSILVKRAFHICQESDTEKEHERRKREESGKLPGKIE